MKHITFFSYAVVVMGILSLDAKGGDYSMSLSGVNAQPSDDHISNVAGGIISLGKYIDQENRHRLALDIGAMNGSELVLSQPQILNAMYGKHELNIISVMAGYSFHEKVSERVSIFIGCKGGVFFNNYKLQQIDYPNLLSGLISFDEKNQ